MSFDTAEQVPIYKSFSTKYKTPSMSIEQKLQLDLETSKAIVSSQQKHITVCPKDLN